MAGPIERLVFKRHGTGELAAQGDEIKTENGAEHMPLVITIAREYGSGGRNIGKIVARKLGIPYYDSEILDLARQENPTAFEAWSNDKKPLLGPLLTKVYDDYVHYATDLESDRDALFHQEEKVICELADHKSCVIVGRLANYILRNRPNTFTVFISAESDVAVRRIMLRDHLGADEALAKRNRINQERRDHCLEQTDSYWGYGANYDMSLKSSTYGIVKSADLILQAVHNRMSESEKAQS